MRLARISGTLISYRGQLQDGAHVELSASRLTADVAGGFLGVAEVRRDGKFSISDVPPGDYVLQARSIPSSVMNEIATTGRIGALTRTDGEFAALGITVSGADVSGITLTAMPTGRLRGRVILDGSPLVPSASRPFVSAFAVGPTSFASGPTSMAALKDATFDIGGIIGEFVIRVSGLDATVAVSSVEARGTETIDSGVRVGPGEVLSDVDVILTSRVNQVIGRVTQDDRRGNCDGHRVF
jgi:hypothetical protein